MTRRRWIAVAIPALLLAAAGGALAQQRQQSRTLVLPADRAGVPNWSVEDRWKEDVFRFVRVEYDSGGGGYGGRGGRRGGGRGFGGGGYGGGGRGYGGGRWMTDWPDSDLNFSFRLQQLTSLKVNPEPTSLRLTDPELFDYPFIYIIEPGNLSFSPEEASTLARYLLNGGFLMVDDFWGDSALANMQQQMKRAFPDREPVELDLSHEIFHNVYRLKEKPQVPSIGAAMYGRDQGITWEEGHDGNTREVHYRGYFDDKARMMAILCHNTDLGDGWEREGEDPWYFREFSEKKAYPMGINIITYAMTH